MSGSTLSAAPLCESRKCSDGNSFVATLGLADEIDSALHERALQS